MKPIYFIITLSLFTNSLLGQCNNQEHINLNETSWLSCTESSSPAGVTGHWIQYNLGHVYQLISSWIWNYNVVDQTNKGFKEFDTYTSIDGQNWIKLASSTLAEASGLSNYLGEAGPDFSGTKAQYVLFVSHSSWGNSCAGLSEIKINVEEFTVGIEENESHQLLSIAPNPSANSIRLTLNNSEEIKSISLYNVFGKQVLFREIETTELRLDVSTLSPGNYLVSAVSATGERHVSHFIKH